MSAKYFCSRCLMLASLLLVCICAHAQETPAAPRTRTPQPEKPFQLIPLKPEFWKVFRKDATLQTLATGFKFTEGPVWDPAGFLWVSDEKGNQIDKVYEDGRVEPMVQVIDPDGSTYDGDHRLWSTSSGARAVIRLSPDGKSFEIIADKYDGKKLNTPNDIVFGPDGAMYFTDPIIDLRKDQEQEQPVSIYRLDTTTHALTLMTRDLPSPNGLAFSPDGKYFYVDDGKPKEIRRYEFRNGTFSNPTTFVSLKDPDHRGAIDGMRVDRKGRIFVTAPNGIWVVNRKGEHIGTVQMPHGMANMAWGGADASKLYIAAGNTVYILQTKTHGFIPWNRKK